MATVDDLPQSCRYKRLVRQPSRIRGSAIGEQGQEAGGTETWIVPDADLGAFVDVIFGLPEVIVTQYGAVTRVVPLRHPEFPGLLATSFETEAKGWTQDADAATPGSWSHHYVSVTFKTRPYGLDGNNAFMSISGQPSTRQIPAPAAAHRIGGAPPTYDVQAPIEGEQFSFSVHQIPTLPKEVFDAVKNRVNATAFFGRPAGTVLYRGASYNQTSSMTGETWEVTHNFEYSPVPWNYGFKTDGTLAPITRADGTYNYPLADLEAVFGA